MGPDSRNVQSPSIPMCRHQDSHTQPYTIPPRNRGSATTCPNNPSRNAHRKSCLMRHPISCRILFKRPHPRAWPLCSHEMDATTTLNHSNRLDLSLLHTKNSGQSNKPCPTPVTR